MRLLPKRILAGFVLGIFFFVIIVASTYSTDQSYQQAIKQLNQDKQVDALSSSLLTELLDAETGQRGFIITGDSSYLQPYLSALESVDSTDQALKGAVVGDANLTAEYNQLQPVISEKLAELNETIALRQTQGFPAAQSIVSSNVGEIYMDQIRGIVAKMTSYNDNTTSAEQASVNALAAQRLDSIYFNGVLAAAFFAFAFYSLNRESVRGDALLAKETRSRTQAELLQDILTHDIRNYNQVTKANAELLSYKVSDEKSKGFVAAIEKATDGSTELIRKTRMLANIMAGEDVRLEEVSLAKSLQSSLSLVKSAFPNKMIEISSAGINDEAQVLADSLLDQVFVNVFSNAAKYTDGAQVSIEIDGRTREEEEPGHRRSQNLKYWAVAITDRGRGIPDDSKSEVFRRYLGQTRGRGLGLSIARALVVDRYSGKIELRNRVEGDYSKGTTVEIWLPTRE